MNQSAFSSSRLPVLFIGHGSPMNAIETNRWSTAWRQLAEQLPPYRAILCISAHWTTQGTAVTTGSQPATIHDFAGFPRELFAVDYPAPGDPSLAQGLVSQLALHHVEGRDDWGIDHGTWSVLCHLRPQADRPVVQLSLDQNATPHEHLAIGRALAPLRNEGVLIIGSGNLTHNLRHAFHFANDATPQWAHSFDQRLADALQAHDTEQAVNALATEEGRLCHPSAEHYWPLLYALGAAAPNDTVTFPIFGFAMSSLSMRSICFA